VVNEPRSVYIPLEGRVAVVSGGGKGLGRSFCLALARKGARVVVNNHNRDADAAGRVVAEIAAMGSEAMADYGDAADPGSGQAMVAAALERWGRLDICVANAATGTPGMFHKQPATEYRTGRIFARISCTPCWPRAGSGKPHEYRVAVDAFNDLMSGEAP
jgi:NAD(P)-dependent dehydrogenase (short-subunit alcohol dehydrogenase family)